MRRRWVILLVLGLLAFSLVVIPFALQIEKRLFVLDASTGKLLHTFELEKPQQDIVGSIAIAGDRIFTETTTKTADHRYRWKLTMMDIQSGKQHWKFAPDVTPSRFWNLAIPTYVSESSVYVSLDNGQEHDQLFALDIATGKPRWRLARDWGWDNWQNSDRGIYLNRRNLGAIEVGDRLIMLAPDNDGKTLLQAVDRETAEPIWQVKFAEVNFPPTNSEQSQTLMSGDRTVTFLDPKGTAHTYDVTTGQLRFTRAKQFINLLQSGSTLYGLNQGTVYAIDTLTGETRWSYSAQPDTNATCAKENGQFKRLQATSQAIYVTCGDSQGATLLALNPQAGDLLWSKSTSGANVVYLELPASNAESAFLTMDEQSSKYISAVSSQKGTQQWQFPPKPIKEFYPSEVVANNQYVFVTNYDPRWSHWLIR